MSDPLAEARERYLQTDDTAAREADADRQRREGSKRQIDQLLRSAVDELTVARVLPRVLEHPVPELRRTLTGRKVYRPRYITRSGWVVGFHEGGGSDGCGDPYEAHLVLTPRARLMSTMQSETWENGGGFEDHFVPGRTYAFDIGSSFFIPPGSDLEQAPRLPELIARAVDDLKAGDGWDPGGRKRRLG